jgi:hypothetical protein
MKFSLPLPSTPQRGRATKLKQVNTPTVRSWEVYLFLNTMLSCHRVYEFPTHRVNALWCGKVFTIALILTLAGRGRLTRWRVFALSHSFHTSAKAEYTFTGVKYLRTRPTDSSLA